MAEVSFLHFPEDDLFVDEICSADDISFPYWSHHHHQDRVAVPTCGFDLDFEAQSDAVVPSSSDRKNQVNFVMDLFHQRVEESHLVGSAESVYNPVNDSTFGVVARNRDVGLHSFDVDLGLGLSDREQRDRRPNGCDNDDEDDNFGGFVVSDCGDDFYIARRENCDGGSSSRGSGGGRGLRVAWIESDSDDEGIENGFGIHVHSDDDDVEVGVQVEVEVEELEDFGLSNVNGDEDDDELGVPLCWDSFQLDEVENFELNQDFEWEEVDDHVDEREVLNLVADLEDEDEGGDGSISVLNISGPEEDVGGEMGRGLGNLEWEVLLNVNNLDRNPDMENEAGPYFGDHDDDIYTAEYEMMFGQFADGENAYLSRPPASKAAVENLPSVVTTEEDLINEKALCAVCKDQIEVGEEGKQLPCSHRYHGDCIIPWLGIRNTCPVCRFELPTDDPDYELRKMRRAARVA